MSAAPSLHVLADDRTGALETAGLCADRGCGPVVVDVLGGPAAAGRGPVRVTDLDTRHRSPAEIEARVGAALGAHDDASGGAAGAHKIDSSLRGNWARELVARRRRASHVVVVAALPGLGRTCRGGVVLVDGVPVAEGPAGRDPRSPVRWSEPWRHLVAAGARPDDVATVGHADGLATWLDGDGGFAVCDAATGEDLDAFAAVWARAVTRPVTRPVNPSPPVLAGTAAAVAAAAAAWCGSGVTPPPAPLAPPVVVVCGSLHPAARGQLAAVDGLPGIEVIASPVVAGPVDPASAGAAAAHLAARAWATVAAREVATLVVLGGDTAAAVLGDRPVTVHGTVAPGTPWCRIDGLTVVTRSGGFGDEVALARLLSARMAP